MCTSIRGAKNLHGQAHLTPGGLSPIPTLTTVGVPNLYDIFPGENYGFSGHPLRITSRYFAKNMFLEQVRNSQ